MSLISPVEDGKIVDTTSSSSLASSSSSTNSSNDIVNSDTFLTMLVAEMQNQDPLEPTSNTEWVSQYATFTMVEELDEMGDAMDLIRANSLVGKNVIMKVTTEDGDSTYVKGIVDYVVFENGKPYLYIDDQPYSIDDLDTVATDEYMEAYDKASDLRSELALLPAVGYITTSYETQFKEMWKTYSGMTDYEKSFLTSAEVESLKSYKTALEALGVSFDEVEEEKAATLDDLLATFNTKMDSLLSAVSGISTTGSSSAGTSSAASTATDNADSVDNETGENLDNVDSADEIADALTKDQDENASDSSTSESTSDSTSESISASESTSGSTSESTSGSTSESASASESTSSSSTSESSSSHESSSTSESHSSSDSSDSDSDDSSEGDDSSDNE